MAEKIISSGLTGVTGPTPQECLGCLRQSYRVATGGMQWDGFSARFEAATRAAYMLINSLGIGKGA